MNKTVDMDTKNPVKQVNMSLNVIFITMSKTVDMDTKNPVKQVNTSLKRLLFHNEQDSRHGH